jgi:hypothetical protein
LEEKSPSIPHQDVGTRTLPGMAMGSQILND